MKEKKLSGFKTSVFLIILLYVIVMLGFLLWALMTSIKTDDDFLYNVYGLPKQGIHFSNYKIAFENLIFKTVINGQGYSFSLINLLLNSLIYAGGCSLIYTFTTCVVAYLLSKYNCKFSRFLHNIIIFTIIIPIVGAIPSEIQMAQFLGLYDSIVGMFIMRMSFLGTYYLIFFAAFKGLSWEYAESAFIDGASHLTVMCKIMFPLIKGIFIAIFLVNFITFWNEYQIPMLYLPSFPTASRALFSFMNSYDNAISSVPLKISGSIIFSLLIIFLYVCFNKQILGNLTMGGLKG